MSATVRLDVPKGLAADLYKWDFEARADYDKKEGPTLLEKVVDVKPMSEVKGSFYQRTTAITDDKLGDKDDYGLSDKASLVDGFTVYGAKKHKSKILRVSSEVAADWHRYSDFIKEFVKVYGPEWIYNTKEAILMDALNNGALTAGHSSFDQNNSDASVPATTANLPYDGVALFSTHTAKSGTTYSNYMTETGLSPSGVANGVNAAAVKDMYVRFAATNAKMENDANFNNTKDIMVLTSIAGEMDWGSVLKSTLNPDDNNNAASYVRGKIKPENVIGTNLLTTTTASILFRKKGVKCFITEPKYEFLSEKEPDVDWFRLSFDYILVWENWRFWLGNNLPQS
jgi:sulfur carrier protein ThiS